MPVVSCSTRWRWRAQRVRSAREAKHRVDVSGFCPLSTPLHSGKTWPLACANLPKAEARKIAQHALERVGLAQYALTLSASSFGRCAAATRGPGPRCCAAPPGDADGRAVFRTRPAPARVGPGGDAGAAPETRASCLLVTHDPMEAMELADRIFLMRKGRLVQSGSPEELYRRPIDAAAARFFSDVNEIAGTAQDGAVTTPLGTFPAPALASGTRAVVLIRPQGIRRARSGMVPRPWSPTPALWGMGCAAASYSRGWRSP